MVVSSNSVVNGDEGMRAQFEELEKLYRSNPEPYINVIDATELMALAKLPSKQELLSQVLAGLQGPGNGLVSVLQGTLRNLLYAMNAIIEKKQSEGGEAEAPQE